MSEIQSYKDYLEMLDPGIKHDTNKPELPEDVCGKDSKNVDNFIDTIPDDSLSELINGISDKTCKQSLENALEFHTSAKSMSAAAFALLPTSTAGGYADARSKSASEYLKTAATAEGCDAVFYNQVATALVVANLTCTSKESVSNADVSINRSTVINIDVGPTPEMVEAHNETIRGYHEALRDLLNSNQSERVLLATNKTIQSGIELELKNWNFSVRNSKFIIDNEDAIDMANTNNIKISEDADVITSIKEKVKQEALVDITKTAEMGAPPESLKSYVQNKLSDMKDEKFLAIVKQANKTEFIKNSNQSITLRVTGYLDKVDVLLRDKNMVYVRSNIIMDAALKLAKEFSSDTILDILAMSTADLENNGLADFQKQLNDAIEAGQKDDGLFGGMFGGIFGGSAIVILLGGFIVYKLTLGGGLVDMGTKIAIILIIVVVLYFGSAYMFSLWPFEDTPDNRIKNFNPIYTNANKLTNKLTNNNTKTPYSRRNQPYVEFNGYQGKLKRTQSSSKYQGGYLKRNKKSSKPYK
jgi:hypothetical protein